MPAAAMSANVGGMGAHWTCACPRPGGTERIDFLPEAIMDGALDRAEELLGVSRDAFDHAPFSSVVRDRLGAEFNNERPLDRRVQPMPLAVRVERRPGALVGRRRRPGDTLAAPTVELLTTTLCRRVLTRRATARSPGSSWRICPPGGPGASRRAGWSWRPMRSARHNCCGPPVFGPPRWVATSTTSRRSSRRSGWMTRSCRP